MAQIKISEIGDQDQTIGKKTIFCSKEYLDRAFALFGSRFGRLIPSQLFTTFGSTFANGVFTGGKFIVQTFRQHLAPHTRGQVDSEMHK